MRVNWLIVGKFQGLITSGDFNYYETIWHKALVLIITRPSEYTDEFIKMLNENFLSQNIY